MSTEMLTIAEERSRSLGLDDIMDFKQSDAENLELGTNQAFDAILCRWGLMFSRIWAMLWSIFIKCYSLEEGWQLLFGQNHQKFHS